MNGGYDVDNDEAISTDGSRPLGSVGLDKGEFDEDEDDDEEDDDEGMEIDEDEFLDGPAEHRARVFDGSGLVRGQNISAEGMDVDTRSNASDVECLGDDKLDAKNVSGSSDDVQAVDQSAEIIDSSLDTDVKLCEENGSVGSPDIEEITDGGKSNGHNSSGDSSKDTPKKKNKKPDLGSVTPRRSSRNVNRKSYMERELGNSLDISLLHVIPLTLHGSVSSIIVW